MRNPTGLYPAPLFSDPPGPVSTPTFGLGGPSRRSPPRAERLRLLKVDRPREGHPGGSAGAPCSETRSRVLVTMDSYFGMSGSASQLPGSRYPPTTNGRERMKLILGIDVASRSAHQASLAGADGKIVFSGVRFRTAPADLDALLVRVGPFDELIVVLEPTRNAWSVLASWFRRHGATIVVVPPTQSADLRAYYSKHTKTDKLDSKILARLPLLHPEGLAALVGEGPADALRRVVKLRSSMAKRRAAIFTRLDCQLELLGPAWFDAIGSSYGKAALAFLTRYFRPDSGCELGLSPLTAFLARHSHGVLRDDKALEILTAARTSTGLWGTDGIDFAELAADIAAEAEQARAITAQIDDLDERIANLYREADPQRIVASATGVAPVLAGVITGRLGDPTRFRRSQCHSRLLRAGAQHQPVT